MELVFTLIGLFTVLMIMASFVAGVITGVHRRFLKRLGQSASQTAYRVEKVIVGGFQLGYLIITGHEWHRRHRY